MHKAKDIGQARMAWVSTAQECVSHPGHLTILAVVLQSEKNGVKFIFKMF